MKITILGCGPSQGVPVIGNRWGSCDPENPKNRRTRSSILVEVDGVSILVDTSPDIRNQFLFNKINMIDAVLYTHLHYDHVGGIGELRTISFLAKSRIDIFGTPATLKTLESNWSYLFSAKGSHDPILYKPAVEPHRFVYGTPFDVHGIKVLPFELDHGICDTAGFRIANFAYTTDVVEMPDSAFEVLEGVDTWIVDCLRTEPHPTHSHLDRTLEWIGRVNPRRAVLTHMNLQTDYATINALCPDGVEPAYDGMTLNIP
ncbi:MAG: Phosphoribosyl 1,2-cyclic phosphodiesterase [Alphaproteobacteria bacterium MarineAlpha11_Bin1]|nr:MAG: Phosphoribosyl 1,2-cyclic phosphodiesterase [Alphaproteobacteria bacterium MarineAlpha11_Bin1]|tara:strand:- start:5412 stop:6188 length:777 start_codon:yes stop_codon:yes gene_type:complete